MTRTKKIEEARLNEEEAASAPQHVVYCGASLPSGILNQHAVFTNGYPKHLEKHMVACPAIKKLFVPVEKFAATLAAIKEKGTPENIFFEQTKNYRPGKGVDA